MRLVTISCLILILSLNGFAKKKGAPPMTSGSPGDRTCLTSKCHAGNELNSDKAQIFIEGLPKVYTPNEIYNITLRLEQKNAKLFGFVATVSDSSGKALGELSPEPDSNIQLLSDAKYKSRTDRQYLTHTVKGIKGPKKGVSPTWQIQWQAPADSEAPSTFYFAFNAANGNKKKTGDHIYTRSMTIAAAEK